MSMVKEVILTDKDGQQILPITRHTQVYVGNERLSAYLDNSFGLLSTAVQSLQSQVDSVASRDSFDELHATSLFADMLVGVDMYGTLHGNAETASGYTAGGAIATALAGKQGTLPTTGAITGTYAINILGNATTASGLTDGTDTLSYATLVADLGGLMTATSGLQQGLSYHIGRTDNPHEVTKAQVGLGNVGNFKAVSTVASQDLTDTEKSNARANIGAGVPLTVATDAALGGIKTGFTQSGRNYPVSVGDDGKAYVNVPWTAANDGHLFVEVGEGPPAVGVAEFTADSSSSVTLRLLSGTYMSLSPNQTNKSVTFNCTLQNQTALKDSTAVSLVTRGDKYSWNSKQDALPTEGTPTSDYAINILGNAATATTAAGYTAGGAIATALAGKLNANGTTPITGVLVPDSNGTRDIGSASSQYFRYIYAQALRSNGILKLASKPTGDIRFVNGESSETLLGKIDYHGNMDMEGSVTGKKGVAAGGINDLTMSGVDPAALAHDYQSQDSMDALLDAMAEVFDFTYTKTWNASGNKYTYTFTLN